MEQTNNKNWILVQENLTLFNNKHYEGAFCQGNGYFSVRASFEEGLIDALQGEVYSREFKSVTTEKQLNPKSKWGTYVPLIMGNHPSLNEVIINLPYFMSFDIWCDNEKLDMETSQIEQFKRELNLKDGTLKRELVWHTTNKNSLKITYFRFPSMDKKHLFVEDITVELLQGEGEIRIQSGIDGRVTTNGYNHFTAMETYRQEDFVGLKCRTDRGDEIVEISTTFCNGISMDYKMETNEIYKIATFKMKTMDKYTFHKRAIIATSRDLEEGAIDYRVAVLAIDLKEDTKVLYDAHQLIWAKKWQDSDVEIQGDDKAQLAMRFSIYHLLRSNVEDPRVAICAKGFAGEAYYGRYFWDTEIFLLPFFIYTNPKAAKDLLMYRYLTLEGAKENAARYNCKGARYPWQSGIRGDEQCSLWEYADNEVHITADIAYAIWHYYKATGDFQFIKEYGVEILVETARFWCDRVDEDKDGTYSLLNVMGPDEYSAMTRNNAFTNRMVSLNLEKAIEALEIIHKVDQEAHQKIIDKLGVTKEELERFDKIATSLPIFIDEKTGVIQQSEDFETYASIDIESLWKDKTKPFGFYATQEKLYRSKCLKQADALALTMLFKNEFTKEQIENTYNYYEPITTHDSSLSPVNHAIIAAWLNKEEDLSKFLNYAIDLDFNPNLQGAAEGIHIANCGCLWQFIMTGVAGISSAIMTETPVVTQVNLPRGWEGVTFKLMWGNKQYQVALSKDCADITLV